MKGKNRDVVDFNYYDFVSGSSKSVSESEKSVVETLDKRRNIQKQIDKTNEELLAIERSVFAIPDPDCGEILIRRYCFGQTWQKIAKEMPEMSIRTAIRKYNDGLEQFGAKLTRFGTL